MRKSAGITISNGFLNIGATGTIRTGGAGVGIRAVETGAGSSGLYGTLATFACTSSADNCLDLEDADLGLTLESFDASTSGDATPLVVIGTTGTFVIDDAADGVVSNSTNHRLVLLDNVDGMNVQLRSVTGAPDGLVAIELTNDTGGQFLVNGDGADAQNATGGVITTTSANTAILLADDSVTARLRSMTLTANASGALAADVSESAVVTLENCTVDGGSGGTPQAETKREGSLREEKVKKQGFFSKIFGK